MDSWSIGRRGFGRADLARVAALAAVSLGASTIAIALARQGIGGFHASFPAPLYLLAVLVVGTRYGTVPAVFTSVAAFLLYDFLFVEPVYTFTINSPDEWLNLLLLLIVATVIGRLAALQAERATEAADRAHEAEALHAITGLLAATRTVAVAAPAIVSRLEEITAMDRVWVGLGATPADERILADTAPSEPHPGPGLHTVLQRGADGQARWVRVHVAGGARRTGHTDLYRIRVDVAGETLGSLWAVRARNHGEPARAETRILSAAADQLGQAMIRDQLTQEATSAEIARQSESLKTALLDSVSHDLRTPLATIRATAGSMLDPAVNWSPVEQREAFESIDFEAERMGRLVRNLLDLSRIEGGALKPELEARDLGELVGQSVARINPLGKTMAVKLDPGLPCVLVDEVFLGQTLANLLENAVRYGGSHIEVRGHAARDGHSVLLTVEDDGEGVPEWTLRRLFDKFYQVPRPAGTARRGMGIGLTVVAGMVGAMGGDVRAERSSLGGLAVTIHLPAVEVPEEAAEPAVRPAPDSAPTDDASRAAAVVVAAGEPAPASAPEPPAGMPAENADRPAQAPAGTRLTPERRP
jgi:two-component system, OmpR family, sensor histidine kinase KdpD